MNPSADRRAPLDLGLLFGLLRRELLALARLGLFLRPLLLLAPRVPRRLERRLRPRAAARSVGRSGSATPAVPDA